MANGATVTYPGRSILLNRLKGNGAEPLFLSWGTGGGVTGAANGNVGLFAPATEARSTGASSLKTTTALADTYSVTGTITCAVAPKTITEVELSDSATLSSTGTLAASLTAGGTTMTLGAVLGVTSGNFYCQAENETILVTGANSATLTVARGQLGTTSAVHASGVAITIGGDGGAGTGGATSGQTATIGAAQGGSCFFHADHGGNSLSIGDSIAYTLTDTLT